MLYFHNFSSSATRNSKTSSLDFASVLVIRVASTIVRRLSMILTASYWPLPNQLRTAKSKVNSVQVILASISTPMTL
ncbi:hypothetical protein MS_015 [Vibrio phage VPMS1]|uniref:hypothetical protein n=1 Tax=Vibrio phage VPMS1 TaxID=1233488 RepID=UPI0003584C75|nr:hypothetical protein MS_015 [Vibrio phage VPMS1]AFV51094.1 hypothetical protein MS_015 [Vibrio phage VPMS1]